MFNISNQYFAPLKNRDLSFLFINLLVYRIFSRFPSLFSRGTGSAAFLSALLSGTLAFAIIFLLATLCSSKKTQNLIDAATLAFGNWGKYIASTIAMLCLFLSAIVSISEFSYLAKLISFPTAPFWFVLLFFSVSAAISALGGTMPLLRIHGIFVPIVLAGILFLVLSVIFRGDTSKLFPILGKGGGAVITSGFSGIIMYSDILLFFLVIPNDTKHPFPKRQVLTSSAIGITLSILFVLALNLSVLPSVASDSSFPFYLVSKEVRYDRFLERIDAIMLFVSSLSGMLYLALNATIFSSVIGSFLKADRKNFIAIPYLSLVAVFALIAGFLDSKILSYLSFVFGFAGIVLLIITALFSRRKHANEKA